MNPRSLHDPAQRVLWRGRLAAHPADPESRFSFVFHGLMGLAALLFFALGSLVGRPLVMAGTLGLGAIARWSYLRSIGHYQTGELELRPRTLRIHDCRGVRDVALELEDLFAVTCQEYGASAGTLRIYEGDPRILGQQHPRVVPVAENVARLRTLLDSLGGPTIVTHRRGDSWLRTLLRRDAQILLEEEH